MFVLVTVLCAWLGYQLNWIRQRREARSWLEHHSGVIVEDGSYVGMQPFPAPWNLRIFGEQGVAILSTGTYQSQDKFEDLKKLFPEARAIPVRPKPLLDSR